MDFNVTINTDDNYIQHTMAMLCSLYENNKEHNITVHVLQKDLSEKSRIYLNGLCARYNNIIKYYEVDEKKLIGVQFRKNRPLSMAAYYRLLLSSVLPQEIEKILYLDCDMVILRDISELFNLEIGGFALAASLDHFPYNQQHRMQLHMEVDERTFCSGIMLVNLKFWRDNNVEVGLLEYAKRYKEVVYLHDQDVLNYYFKKKWFLLPPKWNRVACSVLPFESFRFQDFDIDDYVNQPMLYHYASVGIKPWYDAPSPCKWAYKKYLFLSGYKEIKFTKVTTLKRINLTYITIKKFVKFFLVNVLKLY